MKIAIIGAGLIGKKRALSLPKGVRLEVVCDVNKKSADDFAKEFNCSAEYDWKKIVESKDIEAIIICTPNKYLSIIAEKAILAGKHILIEKPGAINSDDFKKILNAHKKKNVVVMIGYNHRYHPAIAKTKSLIDSKKYGEVLFIRAKYGHGGRLGYEKEWRFNKEISGGGHLLDQGSHLIDLTNFFAGELEFKSGSVNTLFWNTKLEDSAFLILKGKKTVASLVTTCLEWKNLFCFEVTLDTAKIQIDGLGRSYGTEKLTLYEMLPKMGPPKVSEYIYEGQDMSWNLENKEFFKRIKNKEYGTDEIKRAQYVLKIISKAYKSK